ncbi:unnamed protein product, partial [Owenia fusiformis]
MAVISSIEILNLVLRHLDVIKRERNKYWVIADRTYLPKFNESWCVKAQLEEGWWGTRIALRYFRPLLGETGCEDQRYGVVCQYEPLNATSCRKLEAPRFGYISEQSRTVGSRVVLGCIPGYVPTKAIGGSYQTAFVRQCLPSGAWSGDSPQCKLEPETTPGSTLVTAATTLQS